MRRKQLLIARTVTAVLKAICSRTRSMQHQTILGIDIGGTKCAVSIGRTDGKILARKAIATESDRRGPQEVLEILAASARELLVSTKDAAKPSGVGVSCG